MATVNLVPGTQFIIAATRRRNFLVGLSVGLVLLVAISWGALLLWRYSLDRQMRETEGRLKVVETKLVESASVAKRITLFENRLSVMKTLLSTRRSPDPILREVERLLPSAVTLTSLAIDVTEGTLKVRGRGPSIDDIAQMIASFKNSGSHPTIFHRVDFSSIERKDILGADGKPIGADYVFTAQLFLI